MAKLFISKKKLYLVLLFHNGISENQILVYRSKNEYFRVGKTLKSELIGRITYFYE